MVRMSRVDKTLNEVMAKWIASPLHCSNIMNPRYTEYAIACASDQSAKQRSYWTQQFAGFKVDSKSIKNSIYF